jgi:hypothetical protein
MIEKGLTMAKSFAGLMGAITALAAVSPSLAEAATQVSVAEFHSLDHIRVC